jgi:hypothetical protein
MTPFDLLRNKRLDRTTLVVLGLTENGQIEGQEIGKKFKFLSLGKPHDNFLSEVQVVYYTTITFCSPNIIQDSKLFNTLKVCCFVPCCSVRYMSLADQTDPIIQSYTMLLN